MTLEALQNVPQPILTVGKRVFIACSQTVGKNYFKFKYDNDVITIHYTESTFSMVRDLVKNDELKKEGVPVQYLEASEPIDAVIDVGACRGIYSVLLQTLNHNVKLFAFEPNDNNRIILEEFLEENNSNGEVFAELVTDKPGVKTLYVDSIEGSERHSTVSKEGFDPIKKRCVALSDIANKKGLERLYVKIDAEGEELKILEDLLSSNLSFLEGIVELHPDKLDMDRSDAVDFLSSEFNNFDFVTETTPDYEYNRPIYYFRK